MINVLEFRGTRVYCDLETSQKVHERTGAWAAYLRKDRIRLLGKGSEEERHSK